MGKIIVVFYKIRYDEKKYRGEIRNVAELKKPFVDNE